MGEQSTKTSRKERWLTKYTLMVVDDKSLQTKYTFRVSKLRVVLLLAVAFLVVAFLSVMLATQTRLLTFLGSRPKNFMAEDYHAIEAQMDSLIQLSDLRESQFVALQGIITKSIEDEPKREAKEITQKAGESQAQIPHKANIVLGPTSKINHSGNVPGPLVKFISPLEGTITARYDETRDHMGLDMAAVANSQVRASAAGYVIFSDYSRENGYTIWIAHANSRMTGYKHNARLLARHGEFVFQGDAVAIMGNTGESSTGPHLHFELWLDGKAVNPEKIISIK